MKQKISLLYLLPFLFFNTTSGLGKAVSETVLMVVDTPCTSDLGSGDGADGVGTPISNFMAGSYSLDVNGNFESTGDVTLVIKGSGNNVLNFHDFTLNAGHTFTVYESVPQGPVIIKCTGKAIISGTIDLSGKDGLGGLTSTNVGWVGGAGGAGGGTAGGAGGKGSAINGYTAGVNGTSFPGTSGAGAGGSWGDPNGLHGFANGGGGGGYGAAGSPGKKGTSNPVAAAAGGSAYGDAQLTTLINGTSFLGGSGGGGGGGQRDNNGGTGVGGGGGGGGGAISIAADSVDITNGLITVKGGNGGNGDMAFSQYGGGGGGGSAGTVLLQYARSCINCGTAPNTPSVFINISGGTGGLSGGNSGAGGNGAPGRYLLTQVCTLTTAVTEINSEMNVMVYPNPTGNQFTIHNSQFAIEKAEIYNVLGEKVNLQEFEIRNSKFEISMDITNLAKGLYFIQLSGESKNWLGKFIKE